MPVTGMDWTDLDPIDFADLEDAVVFADLDPMDLLAGDFDLSLRAPEETRYEGDRDRIWDTGESDRNRATGERERERVRMIPSGSALESSTCDPRVSTTPLSLLSTMSSSMVFIIPSGSEGATFPWRTSSVVASTFPSERSAVSFSVMDWLWLLSKAI